jgi:hypothetical protein
MYGMHKHIELRQKIYTFAQLYNWQFFSRILIDRVACKVTVFQPSSAGRRQRGDSAGETRTVSAKVPYRKAERLQVPPIYFALRESPHS